MTDKKSYAKLGSRQRAILCVIDRDTDHDDNHRHTGGHWCGPHPGSHGFADKTTLKDQFGKTFGEVWAPADFRPGIDWCGPDDRRALDALLRRELIKVIKSNLSYPGAKDQLRMFVTTENGHILADDLMVDEYPGVDFIPQGPVQGDDDTEVSQ